MKLKATLLTLLLFIGIGLAGCSSNSEKTSSSSSDNKVEKQSDTSSTSSDSQSSAVKDDGDNDDQDDNDSNTSATSSKAKVRYRTVKFQAQLDDVDDSRLYRSVPVTRKTKTASWNSVDAHEGKRAYIDKKAIVLTRDRDDHDDDDDNDDNGYDSEEYYRIRFSASNSAKKYWVEEDVVDTDNDDD